jgi:class 3 adenylate cyclase/alpha-beta hydrolase superfamily lysophospholipase
MADWTPPKTKYAHSGDAGIAYQAFGEGERDLVVVPGFVSHVEVAWEHHAYERFMRRLGSFARVVVFDKRGAGLSDPLEGAETLEQRIDDITTVMDAVESRGATLFGISEGAAMAALFAAMHPDRVESLVLYGMFPRGSASEDWPHGMPDETWEVGLQGMHEAWGEGVSAFLLAPVMAQEDPAFLDWWGHFERMSSSPRNVIRTLELDRRIDIRGALPTVQAPTLVLHREGDAWPIAGAEYVAETIPGAKLVRLSGENHWPWVDDTDAVADEIESFLTGGRTAGEPDRVLATVLFTDIVDSTAKAAELGDKRWRWLLDEHEAVVRRQLDRFGGREVKTTGDGFLATFDGPARAVRCARAIADAVLPLGIDVRAGLHSGECELRNGDIGGIAVHIGARVSARATAGEVLVSGTVRDLVIGSGIEFEDRGEQELKGVPGSWRLFSVTETA